MKNIMNTSITSKNINEEVTLYGWVAKKRNLGGLIFIDLRDRSGIIQLVIKPEDSFYELASSLKNEYVIKVCGIVEKRENINNDLKTGEIEIKVTSLEKLNRAKELPYDLNANTALEDTRLKYRYLDLRKNELNEKLKIRHKTTMAVRKFFDENNFYEIETPVLCKSTPEGARDYLVPSRVNKGKYYALPQSPQMFKQLLMVGGMERYFQIAKCFRDEDLRKDRQPEFTQIDVEMSFVDEFDVMSMAEKMIAYVFKEIKNIDVSLPLMKMKYNDAIDLYGSDKPDLRFDMPIKDITDIFKNTEIEFLKSNLDNNGIINCLVINNNIEYFTRKSIDKLTDLVKTYKAKGLAYLKYEDELNGSIAKLLSEEEKNNLINTLSLEKNDVVLIVSDIKNITKTSLGALRVFLGQELNLIDKNIYKMHWVVDFPSFEWSEEEQRFMATHHPFTAPKDEDVDKLLTDKANCYSKAYDLVINGYEAGGGSIRIHDEEVQTKMFEALELNDEQINNKFGYFVEALKYGTPPHGGIAFGLDRLIMLLANTDNIRDVIAFPKTLSASDLMSECPNYVDEQQLEELRVKNY